jgi:hypothetical protein
LYRVLTPLCSSFCDTGYADGFAHGRIHGLIEGRALGREKGFEMWEELAFYEGFARTWQAVYTAQGRDDECVLPSQGRNKIHWCPVARSITSATSSTSSANFPA